jgi:hypothetical protein
MTSPQIFFTRSMAGANGREPIAERRSDVSENAGMMPYLTGPRADLVDLETSVKGFGRRPALLWRCAALF